MQGKNSNSDNLKRREKAFCLRYSYIEEMEKHLLAFESQLTAHGINVRWIDDEASLCSQTADILPNSNYNKVCFDLPYIPAELHKSNLINCIPVGEVQANLEEPDLLVVKADFGIAETGSIVFVNRKPKNYFNKVRNILIILDIDRVIVRQEDLPLFLSILDNPDSGEDAVHDIKIINGVFKHIVPEVFQTDGHLPFTAENVNIYLFLYNNGITDIMQDKFLRQSLYCIHCGRCLSVCPAIGKTDGVAPIDFIKRNCFEMPDSAHYLFSHTALCGNCEKVCPVNIPLVDLIVYEMQLENSDNPSARSKRLYSVLSRRSKMNKCGSLLMHRFFVNRLFGGNKTLKSYFYCLREKSFNLNFNSLDENYNDDLEPEDITK